jgi:hypothetical protein
MRPAFTATTLAGIKPRNVPRTKCLQKEGFQTHQRRVASFLPPISNTSFHESLQVLVIYIYIYIYIHVQWCRVGIWGFRVYRWRPTT